MITNEHLTQFAGKAVEDWDPEKGIVDPINVIYRLRLDYDEVEQGERWPDLFAKFLDDPASSRIPGLVVGNWGEAGIGDSSALVIDALVAARPRLPALRAIFLGDITMEEAEISWIQQSDVSPLLAAYQELEEFGIRGAEKLSLGNLGHECLKSLIIQSGGLSRNVVQQVAASPFPKLEHLELWLGVDSYGGDTTIDDLLPILSGQAFPELKELGLRDSEIADAIAAAIVDAPILERLRVLDLSLGTLGDEGAEALLSSPAILKLRKLDLHHHFCSPEMTRRLEELEIEVDASDPQEPDRYDDETCRFVAVSE